MGRWEPNAQGRLEQAALDLYVERGFEQTTVAEIAKRAGLTERTFFRYFADKREVLFGGAKNLEEVLTREVVHAPVSLAPLAAATAEALRQRGVKDPVAALAAEAGIAVFKIAFARWVDPSSTRDFAALIEESLAELKAVAAAV